MQSATVVPWSTRGLLVRECRRSELACGGADDHSSFRRCRVVGIADEQRPFTDHAGPRIAASAGDDRQRCALGERAPDFPQRPRCSRLGSDDVDARGASGVVLSSNCCGNDHCSPGDRRSTCLCGPALRLVSLDVEDSTESNVGAWSMRDLVSPQSRIIVAVSCRRSRSVCTLSLTDLVIGFTRPHCGDLRSSASRYAAMPMFQTFSATGTTRGARNLTASVRRTLKSHGPISSLTSRGTIFHCCIHFATKDRNSQIHPKPLGVIDEGLVFGWNVTS